MNVRRAGRKRARSRSASRWRGRCNRIAAMRALLAATLLCLTACTSNDPAAHDCHFVSGRPCADGDVCMGAKGDECNYPTCVDGDLFSGAVFCQPGTTEPVPGGPFNCDPATIPGGREGVIIPPNGTCPLGSLYALDPARAAPYLFCVPVAQCAPIPCDPQWNGDGCPADFVCDSGSRTCVAP